MTTIESASLTVAQLADALQRLIQAGHGDQAAPDLMAIAREVEQSPSPRLVAALQPLANHLEKLASRRDVIG